MTEMWMYYCLFAMCAVPTSGLALSRLSHAAAQRLLSRSLTMTLAWLRLFAGPYRVLAFKPRCFGSLGQSFATWLGVVIAFPLTVAAFADDGYVPWPVWLALLLCTYAQMTMQWCSKLPPRDATTLHFWCERGELLFACLLSYAASIACGPGGFLFCLAGYTASVADCGLRRLRSRLQDWTPEDTSRLIAPFYLALHQLKASGASGARFALTYGWILIRASGRMLVQLWRWYRQRKQQPV